MVSPNRRVTVFIVVIVMTHNVAVERDVCTGSVQLFLTPQSLILICLMSLKADDKSLTHRPPATVRFIKSAWIDIQPKNRFKQRLHLAFIENAG